jgi:hypothetical protein
VAQCPAPTLAHGALHVAHDEAVLVVQELHAHLGDLLDAGGRSQAPLGGSHRKQGSRVGTAAFHTWPREPVRPMTFITIASLAG